MDPTTCLRNILENSLDLSKATTIDDEAVIRDFLRENLQDLADWLEKGGFAPNVASADWNWPGK